MELRLIHSWVRLSGPKICLISEELNKCYDYKTDLATHRYILLITINAEFTGLAAEEAIGTAELETVLPPLS